MRQRLDITDVEAQTKIRAKYLRALENVDFGMLPGATFVKSFLRTYAEFLGLDPDADDMLGDAIATVVQMGTASTSMLQRRLRVGYTRAGRLIDMMERRGVISGYEGSKARQVLITEADLPRILEALGDAALASADSD